MRKIFLCLLTMMLSIHANASLTTGIDGHKAGDVISIRTDSEVAAYCNFDKQIVVTASTVLCVYNGSKNSAN
jgi:hypothetical protein